MIPVQRAGPGRTGARSLVVLPKAGLIEDVAASVGADPAFGVLALDRTLTKAVCHAFLPRIGDDNSYLSDPAGDQAAKAELRTFWRAVLGHLARHRRIDAFVTGNFSYHAEQELAAAATELHIPFIALHKECRKTPRLADFYEQVYRDRKGPFQGSQVLTYNQIEKDIQTAAEVTKPGIIEVTGMARLDAVHRRRRREAAQDAAARQQHRPTVLFFSVFDKYGLPFIRRVVEGRRYDEPLPPELEALNWSTLMSTLHQAMIELARAHGDIDVVIKTKGDPVAAETLKRMFGEVLRLPANVRLVSGGDPLDLIFAADVVCGFNTTALVEAVAADVPVVVPAFAEAVAPQMAGYVMDLGNAVIRAESREHLIESLVDLAHRGRPAPVPELGPEQCRALEHWVGNADGQAGQRVCDALLRITAPAR